MTEIDAMKIGIVLFFAWMLYLLLPLIIPILISLLGLLVVGIIGTVLGSLILWHILQGWWTKGRARS